MLRSEPSETSYYMQEYLQAAAPAEFAKIPFFKPPITEYLQSETAGEFTQTQQGVQSEVNYITNEAGGAEAYSLEGIVTALPPSALTGAKYFLPPGLNFNGTPAPYEPAWAGIQNASGQWVTPTTATIDAAVDAGGAQPLYALTNRVPGKTPAYPLTYIDNLYVPAHGVSADKAEAIATIIRYGVTAGQDAMPPQNDGQLSPGLVQQALSAANQVIASNCTGSGEQVIVSDSIGRYAPSLRALDGKSVAQRESELASIGPMLHCVTASSAPSTTPSTAPGTVPSSSVPSSTAPAVSTSTATGSGGNGTGSGSGSGSTPSASSSPASPSSSTQPGSSSSTGSGSSSGASPGGPVTLLNLPLPLPWSGTRGYDRLVAMVLGGLAFLLLWRSRDSLGRVFRS